MASKIVGRRGCPWCGFDHAHVKESDKCLYFYCPACGTNGPHARTDQQRANMVKGMRAEGSQHSPTPTPTEAKAAPAVPPAVDPPPTPTEPRDTEPTPTPPPAKRRPVNLFSWG